MTAEYDSALELRVKGWRVLPVVKVDGVSQALAVVEAWPRGGRAFAC